MSSDRHALFVHHSTQRGGSESGSVHDAVNVSSDERSSLLDGLDLPTNDFDSEVVELGEDPGKVGMRSEGESSEGRSSEVAT